MVNGTVSSDHIFVCMKYASHRAVLSYAVSLVGGSKSYFSFIENLLKQKFHNLFFSTVCNYAIICVLLNLLMKTFTEDQNLRKIKLSAFHNNDYARWIYYKTTLG